LELREPLQHRVQPTSERNDLAERHYNRACVDNASRRGSSPDAEPPANPGPGNPAINKSEGNNPGSPVAGRNSFTEGQAKSRIESSGYSDVTGLKKDDNGVWRGKAKKDGKSVDVSLDFQGNIVAQ
jgi:hypothetical protein